tara:strand:- start:27 stop:197 length:171 start_codon:yes stop_codon:yes gene_type:complete
MAAIRTTAVDLLSLLSLVFFIPIMYSFNAQKTATMYAFNVPKTATKVTNCGEYTVV